ncbi:MAG TPA: hypothetical protein DCG75_18715 [Bacteroidales bacterium]|nr:hypothetical protein [Bacteroidales bacterium]
MKKLIYLFLFAFIASSAFMSCDDDEPSSPFKTVMLGAQENTTIDGFYSINLDKTYTLVEAAANQATIDLFCYYDGDKNKMTLTSPGANIAGVFTGDNAPENWEIQDTTYFHQLESTVLSVEQFDALTAVSPIETYYSEVDPKRKAKELAVDDLYAFITEDNYYGIFKVVSVIEGATGSVEFKYIIKK